MRTLLEKSVASLGLPLVISLLLGGCQRMPSQSRALEWLDKHEPTLKKIEAELRASLGQLPYAGPTFRCPPAPPPKPTTAGVVIRDQPCFNAYTKWQNQALFQWKRFESKTGARWLELPNVVGVDVRIRRRIPLSPFEGKKGPRPGATWFHEWHTGCSPRNRANKHGSRSLESGITHGRYRVGWGLGQLAFRSASQRYDDASYRPWLDVKWSFRLPQVDVEVEVNLLPEGTVPEAWRKARMATCH